jgi:hypothetical protein
VQNFALVFAACKHFWNYGKLCGKTTEFFSRHFNWEFDVYCCEEEVKQAIHPRYNNVFYAVVEGINLSA